MQKKLLLFIILVSFIFYSCLDYDLPKQIELELEGSIDLPVNTSTSNWGAIVVKYLKDAFLVNMDERLKQIEIYNVDSGEDVQAFCVYMPIEISDSLNPSEYLKDIDGSLIDLEGETKEIKKTVNAPSSPVLVDDKPVPILSGSVTTNFNDIQLGANEGFLHAVIDEGSFIININDEHGIPMEINDYTININQAPDPNPPLSVSTEGLSAIITKVNPSLEGKNINRMRINISVTIKITNPSVLLGYLTITMNISKYKELDWYMDAAEEMETEALSLNKAAEVLNWISFAPCDENGETAGIGIRITFSEETSDKILKGLQISVKCDALKFDNVAKPLNARNIMFGNKSAFTLYLNEDEKAPPQWSSDAVFQELKFLITLSANNNDNPNVLKLTDIEVGEEPLSITGVVKFFQHWKQANVIMATVLRADPGIESAFEGTFPDPAENADPIDLSLLNNYIPGFGFNKGDLIAYAYLSGPDKTINGNPNLLDAANLGLAIDAQYNDTSSPAMKQNPLKLEKKHIVLKGNSDYLDNIDEDGNGTYKYKDKNGKLILPPDGNPCDFLGAINAQPQDLRFHYNVDVPETITVEPDMFVDDGDHDIVATIIMLITLRLTAGDKGGKIKLPDMFNGREDLLGRNPDSDDPTKPGKNSMLTSLEVDYIDFTIDFAGTFFNGGIFFIEQDNDSYKPILFPTGIPVDGSTIALKIKKEDFDKIKDNFIRPELRLEFEKGGKIAIPRNMGLTSVKLEAKGKNTLLLDF